MKNLFRSVVALFVLIAAMMAVIPAALAGKANGGPPEPEAWLEVVPCVNSVSIERNANTGRYWVRPGQVISFIPRFVQYNDKSGGSTVVPPPVQPFSWEVRVWSGGGVVAPYRSRSSQRQQQWMVKKAGTFYVTATAASENPAKEYLQLAAETITSSTSPAPSFSIALSLIEKGNVASVNFKSNVALTNGRLYCSQYAGNVYVSFSCDQGYASAQYKNEPMTSWVYVPGSCVAVKYMPNGTGISWLLPDGAMDYSGLALSVPSTLDGTQFWVLWEILAGTDGKG